VLRDVTRRRFGADSLTHAFSVLGADAAEIGTITRSGSSDDSYVIAIGGRSVATARRVPRRTVMSEQKSSATPMTLIRRAKQLIDGVTSMVWRVEDEPGHSTRSASASRMSKAAPVRPRAHLQAAQELERAQTDLDAAFRAFAGYEAESAARERMAELRQARDSAQLVVHPVS
jgi:hypothetical protein